VDLVAKEEESQFGYSQSPNWPVSSKPPQGEDLRSQKVGECQAVTGKHPPGGVNQPERKKDLGRNNIWQKRGGGNFNSNDKKISAGGEESWQTWSKRMRFKHDRAS